ncbi:MAG: hypothetical protein JWO04_418 [Gammaproteobacteria bacterium]|nr:hypothetical protein [Gammaproteobacteria bacterium]
MRKIGLVALAFGLLSLGFEMAARHYAANMCPPGQFYNYRGSTCVMGSYNYWSQPVLWLSCAFVAGGAIALLLGKRRDV